jgi:Mg2+ and Co2+ transporter CorA
MQNLNVIKLKLLSDRNITKEISFIKIEELKKEISNFNVREMYIIDGNYSFDISSMIFKKKCILLKFDFLRAIVFIDKVYLLKINSEHYNRLFLKLSNLIKEFDTEKYFHLHVIDFLFTYICDYFFSQVTMITPKISANNDMIKHGNYNYHKFISLQSDLINLEYRIKELRNMTGEIEDNKEDIKELSLSNNEEIIDNAEEMIENYSLKFQDLENDIGRLTRETDNIQKIVNIDLAKKRNNYAVFSIYISITSLAFSFGSFIGSMFGMNLKNNLEESNLAFILTWIFSLFLILICIMIQLVYFNKRM